MKNNPPNRSIRVLTTLTLLVLASAIVLAHWGVEQDGPADLRSRMYPSARSGGNYMHNYYFPMAPSSSPWYPAWSPDGKRITVSLAGSIWNVDPATGIADELAFGPKYLSSPTWSPDGKTLVYTADEDNQTIQLESLDLATGATTALTEDTFIYTDPVFSPDGTRLAYVSTKPNGFFNVFIRPIRNGRWAGDEVQITTDHRYPRNRLYFGFNDVHISPAWTRDGMHLLVVSNREVPLGSGHLWKIPVEADAMAKAKPVLTEQSLFRARPDVSIDGKRFIYSSHRGAADQYDNLYVLPVDGGEPYKMTLFDYDAFHPRWSPDGESIAYISNEGGVPRLAVMETYGGGRRNIDIVQRRWKRPVGVVSIQTVDAGTEQATPARIHLTASDGKFYAPPDTYARIAQGSREHVFHTTGRTRVEVPAGKLRLEAVKGFEYFPEQADVEIRANEATLVTMKLKPMTDMAALGWYSGSTHMHMNYGGNLHNTLENLMLMSAAEDQDVVNELIANKDNRVLDYQFFVPGGGAHPISKPDRLVIVGQEYRPPFYGHVILLGLRDHLLSPWSTGYEGTGIESLYPSNTDMLRKAKAQNATTDYAHSFGGDNDPILSPDLGQAKGFIVDAALKTADGIEWAFSGRAPFFPWYAVLNNGLRVTGTGGEDSMSDLHVSKLVGSSRTYVYTGSKGLDARAWMDGLRDGRAFMSTGPLVSLTVNGRMPGGDVQVPAEGGTVDIAGWVTSLTPLDKVMLISNGELLAEIPLPGDRKKVEFARQVKVSRSSWLHLRVEGLPAERHPLDTGFAQAFTNPIWVTVGNQPVRNRAAAEYCVAWIDKLQALAAADPGWRSQREKDHVFAQFDEARQIYRKFAQEAAQVKPTAQAAELLPAVPGPGQRERASALELLAIGGLLGLALVGRHRSRPRGIVADSDQRARRRLNIWRQRMKRVVSWVIAVLMIFTGASAFAQATGTLNGRVVDQADAVLPGATVTATNTRTGVARTTVTNAEGLYSLPALEPGLYNVNVDLAGFAPSIRREVALAVSATVTLDIMLQLGAVSENIVVSGAAPLIETTQSAARATLVTKEVESLPLLNRNFTGMVTLLPGARPIGAVNATKQSVGQMSFSGGQGRNLNTVVDGGDNRDESVGGVVQNYTVEGIEEFTLSTSRFSAANGRSAGALLTIVTKSGTNELHGSGFLFGRDEALTGKDYFAKQSNQPKVPFSRQQFGGSTGGPLVRNRAFLFGAIERIREEQSISLSDGAFRELELLIPLGAEPVRAVPRSYRDTQYTVKANLTLTQNQSAIVRFAEQRARQTNNQVNVATKDQSAPTEDVNRMYSLLGSHTAILSPRTLNQFTFQKTYLQNSLDATGDTWNLPFGRNLSFPSVSMGRQVTQQLNRQDKLQFRDDFTAQLGTHALKVGADYVRLPAFAVYQERDGNGNVTFFDDPSVILADKVRYPQGFQTAGAVRQFTVGNSVGDGSFINAQQFSTYVQDDWKATRRLSLNLGLRYDVNVNFINETVMANSRTYEVLQAIGDPNGALPKTDTNDISPRVGFAYNVRGDGQTVLRGGYGLYYDAMTLSVAFPNLYQMKEFIKVTTTLVNTAIGRGDLATYRFGIDPPLASAGNVTEFPRGGRTTGGWYDPNLTNPYNHQTNLGFSHQLTPRTVLDADYTRVRGKNYYRNSEINPLINGVRRLAPVLGTTLGDPNLLGASNILGSTSPWNYDELAVKFVHRAARLNWQASYTLSNAEAYGGGVGITGATAGPQDWDAPNAPGEWGPVRVDERHRVVLFAVAELPFDIRVSPIFQASTPRAYTLTAGVDLNADGSANDRYIDPATGRQVSINSERGDALALLDLRVTKFITMGSEKLRIGVFAEFYNLFNTANFGNNYNGNARSTQFKQPVGFMGGAAYPFQMQLGVRASF